MKNICIHLQYTYPMAVEGSEKHYQWLYNVLEKKAEAERIVYEDTDPETGFIILPDIGYSEGGNNI
jgi:hypothetical protein